MQKGSCPRRHMHGMLEGQVCCHEDCGHGGCLLKGDREGHRDQQGAVSQDMRSQGTCHLPKYSLACSGPIGTCVRYFQEVYKVCTCGWIDAQRKLHANLSPCSVPCQHHAKQTDAVKCVQHQEMYALMCTRVTIRVHTYTTRSSICVQTIGLSH